MADPDVRPCEEYRREAWEWLERARDHKAKTANGMLNDDANMRDVLSLMVKHARVSMQLYRHCLQKAEIEDNLKAVLKDRLKGADWS